MNNSISRNLDILDKCRPYQRVYADSSGKLQTTDSWYDKFWVCVYDVLSLGGITRKTHEVVKGTFEEISARFKQLQHPIDTLDIDFSHLKKIICIQKQKEIYAPWGIKLTIHSPVSNILREHSHALSTENLRRELQTLKKNLKDFPIFDEVTPTLLDQIEDALALAETDEERFNAAEQIASAKRKVYQGKTVHYKGWNLQKKQQSLFVVEQPSAKITCDYYEFTPQVKAIKGRPYYEICNNLLELLRKIPAHRRHPVTIKLPDTDCRTPENPHNYRFVINSLKKTMNEHPELFPHKAELFLKVSSESNYCCLSHLEDFEFTRASPKRCRFLAQGSYAPLYLRVQLDDLELTPEIDPVLTFKKFSSPKNDPTASIKIYQHQFDSIPCFKQRKQGATVYMNEPNFNRVKQALGSNSQ